MTGIVRKILLSSRIAFSVLAGNALPSEDSIKVVEGQVSDYYIPVVNQYEITGTVVDEQDNPLEGVTVMFFSSPVHCNTNIEGHYTLRATDNDVHLYAYYPGKSFANVKHAVDDRQVKIVMQSEKHKSAQRQPAQATRWYDPAYPVTRTYCNPMNISYNYEPYSNNVQSNGSFRFPADPMGLTYKDEHFPFSMNQRGFHYSKNLGDWEFVPASFQRRLTDDDMYAPAAFISGDTLFYTGSTYEGLPVWYSTSPKSGRFKRAIERNILPSWDPCLSLDSGGKFYLHYGSSNEHPLEGVQISRDDFRPISKIYDITVLRPEGRGWERFGMNNDNEVMLRPFTEGAYMTKHSGKCYFQYDAPGTEFKVYADGVYVSDLSLGPFTYQQHNLMSYKPGGFVQGVGHSGTFQDLRGSYWHVGTCMLSLKYKSERRIGLYPTAFDPDGVMYSITALDDYPCWNADYDIKNLADRFTGWILLSYEKPVKVSSTDSIHSASNLTDENMRTYWAAKTGEPGEWVGINLGAMKHIKAIQLNYYDHKSVQHNRANDLYYQYRIYSSDNGMDWALAIDKSDNDKDVPHDYIRLGETLDARYLKLENIHAPSGNFYLSEFRVFGFADREKPLPVRNFKVVRDKQDKRNVMISWNPSSDAYGYNIYYGITPEKLYNCITANSAGHHDFRGFDPGTTYYLVIEALNESGRSALSKVVKQ